MEDRRRRGIAFEKLAKEMLRYVVNSEEVKVGTAELQERPICTRTNRCFYSASGRAGEE